MWWFLTFIWVQTRYFLEINVFYAFKITNKMALKSRRSTVKRVRLATIPSDSKLALHAIQNPRDKWWQKIIHAIIWAATNTKTHGIFIRLQWIPGHCGMSGMFHRGPSVSDDWAWPAWMYSMILPGWHWRALYQEQTAGKLVSRYGFRRCDGCGSIERRTGDRKLDSVKASDDSSIDTVILEIALTKLNRENLSSHRCQTLAQITNWVGHPPL